MEWLVNIVLALVSPAPFIAGALISGIIVLVLAQVFTLAYRRIASS